MILSNALLQIDLSSSRLVCVLLGGKGGRVLYTLSMAGSAGVESRSTLFPGCRSIFSVVCQSTFVLSCRSISTSSSNSLLPPRGRWLISQCWVAPSLEAFSASQYHGINLTFRIRVSPPRETSCLSFDGG
ncbi:hypothetical protein F2Q70_00031842 [Brassica cretica]|uniref:Uncharacterized protein n=1 Tax=Brassica cretica TaxID=69181 RepID=A0A8S9FJF3_BRACR|nr:hypothetical protein F2Q70_00031842 [Brassica cretica]